MVSSLCCAEGELDLLCTSIRYFLTSIYTLLNLRSVSVLLPGM